MGLERHFGRLFVADHGRERRHQHERAAQQIVDAAGVGLHATHTMLRKAAHAIGQQANTLQHVVRHHRAKHVQFKVARRTRNTHHRVVAQHLRRDHGQRLALCGIDLARHDRRTRFIGRQAQFTQPSARATAQPAHVVGDFHQRAGQSAQAAMRLHHGILAAQRCKLVGRIHKRFTRLLRQLGRYGRAKTSGRIQPGAHGRTANGQSV